MSTDNKEENSESNEAVLKHKLVGSLCRWDDSLLSFLCGIFSNVPVSLCLAFTKLESLWQGVIFVLTLPLSIFSSAMVVVFALKFTLRRIRHISPKTIRTDEDGDGETFGIL